jgi:hypothetical protein
MITDRSIDQAYSDLKDACGGSRNDYFGLLYLEQENGLSREKARNQVGFGGNDYGLDGFHLDAERRNLYRRGEIQKSDRSAGPDELLYGSQPGAPVTRDSA